MSSNFRKLNDPPTPRTGGQGCGTFELLREQVQQCPVIPATRYTVPNRNSRPARVRKPGSRGDGSGLKVGMVNSGAPSRLHPNPTDGKVGRPKERGTHSRSPRRLQIGHVTRRPRTGSKAGGGAKGSIPGQLGKIAGSRSGNAKPQPPVPSHPSAHLAPGRPPVNAVNSLFGGAPVVPIRV